jgi:hypothetical protein
MKSVNLELSDLEFNQLGLNTTSIKFSELLAIIQQNMNKRILEKSVQLADKYGLSKLTMDEINEEIEAYRNAKTDS